MSKIWKRLWIPVIFFVLMVIAFILMDVISNEDVSGAIGSLGLFVFFPFFVVSLFWAIIKSARQTSRVKKGLEPMPEDGYNPVQKIWYAVTGYFKNQSTEYKDMNSALKKRFWKFKIIGGILVVVAIGLYVTGYNSTFLIILATLVLIGGLALFLSAASSSYNSGNDVVKMITMNNPKSIEEIFEAFKDYKTPLGSPLLAKIKYSNNTMMIFGPDSSGFYVYCWVNDDKTICYVGDSVFYMVKEVLVESSNPYKIVPEEDLSVDECVCLKSSVYLLKANLYKVIEEYFKTGNIVPLEDYGKASIYKFDERFKLLGQKFNLYDTKENDILHIEGTAPLISLKITDPADNTELFKVVKQIDQLLTTYNFYKDGNFYGTLQRDPSLYKDKFSMDTADGKIELIENAGYIGANYTVKINDKVIGTIMDNLDLTIRNLVFDNSVLFVYDNSYVPLMTAMAVMVAREIARDRDRRRESSDSK